MTNSFPCTWSDGVSTEQLAAQIALQGEEIVVTFADRPTLRYRRSQMRLSSYISGVPLNIRCDDNSTLTIPDGPFVRSLAGYSGVPARIENRMLTWLPGLLLGTVAVAYVLYAYILPVFGVWVADRLSVASINKLGDMVYEYLQENEVMDIVNDDPDYAATVAHINETGTALLTYRQLDDTRSTDYNYRYFVASGNVIRRNAFALPNGHIVFSDPLYQLLNEDEVSAVLAHEIAHVELRHSAQNIARAGLWFVLINLVLPDVMFSYLPLILSETSYSRNNERASDCYAAAILTQAAIPPVALVDAFQKLYDSYGKPEPHAAPETASGTPDEAQEDSVVIDVLQAIGKALATHPAYDDRAENIYRCADLPGPP